MNVSFFLQGLVNDGSTMATAPVTTTWLSF